MSTPQNALEDPRTRATVYVVEATNDERHGLWREFSEEAKRGNWGSPGNLRVPWQQDASGWGVTVGTLADYPVCMSLTWALISGSLVMFWDTTSRVVDYEMCEAWLREHVPAYAEHHCNATNFGHCLSFLKRGGTT